MKVLADNKMLAKKERVRQRERERKTEKKKPLSIKVALRGLTSADALLHLYAPQCAQGGTTCVSAGRTTAALLLQGDRSARARRSRGKKEEEKRKKKKMESTPRVWDSAPSERQSLSGVA